MKKYTFTEDMTPEQREKLVTAVLIQSWVWGICSFPMMFLWAIIIPYLVDKPVEPMIATLLVSPFILIPLFFGVISIKKYNLSRQLQYVHRELCKDNVYSGRSRQQSTTAKVENKKKSTVDRTFDPKDYRNDS